MARGEQITRQWRILRFLEQSRQGLRARELHQRLDEAVSERTLYRDLQDLQDAGFPLIKDDDDRWRCPAPGGGSDPGGHSVPIHTSELLAVLLSEELLAPMRSAEVTDALSSLRSKITALLSPSGRAYAEELKGHLIATFVGPGDYRDNPIVRDVEDAIARQHRVEITYWSRSRADAGSDAGAASQRTVDPYLLWIADARLYLVGWCHLRDAVRTFSVDRIRAIAILDQSFDPDPGFDARAFTGSGLGAWSGERRRVELEFTPAVAHLAHERRYHATQTVTERPDGSARVMMHVAGLPHVAAWVASFGGQIIVRSPQPLIEMVREVHVSGLAAHGGGAE